MHVELLREFCDDHELIISERNSSLKAIAKKEPAGWGDKYFGTGSCIGPKTIERMMKDNSNPVKLLALVACDTLDEIYHGLYDASFISALRTTVFFGIVQDAFKKTVENIEVEDATKVDLIIQRFLDYQKQERKINEL